MANQEHLEIFKKGVTVWNKWREQNPDIQPDLSDVKLTGTELVRAPTTVNSIDLRGINLSRTNLSNSWLINSDLRGANLSGANLHYGGLRNCDLRDTKLVGAYLVHTNLRYSNLSGNCLREHDLHKAYLMDADLRGADLTGANLHRADLSHANLTGAKLNNCDFTGTSVAGAKIHGASLTGIEFSSISATVGSPEIDDLFDFALADGLDAVAPESRTQVVNYIAEAFKLAHIIDQDALARENVSDVWGQDYVDVMTNRIKFLHSVYAIRNTPSQLVDVVKLLTGELIQYLKKHPRAIYEIGPSSPW